MMKPNKVSIIIAVLLTIITACRKSDENAVITSDVQ